MFPKTPSRRVVPQAPGRGEYSRFGPGVQVFPNAGADRSGPPAGGQVGRHPSSPVRLRARKEVPAPRVFSVVVRDVLTNYSAQPAAWAEIAGYGPAARSHPPRPWPARPLGDRSDTSALQRGAREP
jgi:hypothetical protein